MNAIVGSGESTIQNSMHDPCSIPSFSHSSLNNYPLIAAFLGFATAQSIKLFTVWYRERRWDVKQLIGSGGMPSSHVATVTALAAVIGLRYGFSAPAFAVALVLDFVVMFDALGVRQAAGRQAVVLNQIVCELPAEHPLAHSIPLREFVGHTTLQVLAGCLLGLVIAIIVHFISITVEAS